MLRSSNPTRRIAGRLLVVTGIAAALPLTASSAVDYVDVPAPAISTAPVSMHTTSAVPTRSSLFAAAPRMTVSVVPAAALTAQAQPISATIPVTSIAAAPTAVQPVRASEPEAAALTAAAVAPVETTAWHDSDTNISIHDDLVTIDGVTKRWEDLTPAEMARVRAAVAKARASLAKTHIDQAQLMRDVASIPDQRRIAEIQNNLARAQANIANSIRRIDERAARDRAAGRSPDQLDAAIRSVLQSAQGRDLQAGWKALANIDRQKIAGEVAGAQGSIEAAKAELARIQARIDADQRQ